MWVGALHAILLFPTPWPPLKRHRWIAVALYTAPFITLAVVTLAQSPANALEWHLRTGSVVNSLQLAYVLLAMAAAVRSYRVARDPESKAQVRWVATAFIFVFFCNLALGIIPQAVLGYSFVSWNVLALIGLLIPLAFAFAILRYRLFEIDVILNRMLVYGTLTVAVSALYVVVVGALSTLFQLQNNLAISLVVTAIVAVAFQPVRDGLQRAVNRFMYGEPRQSLRRSLTPWPSVGVDAGSRLGSTCDCGNGRPDPQAALCRHHPEGGRHRPLGRRLRFAFHPHDHVPA